jgi:exosortase family protein XrtG
LVGTIGMAFFLVQLGVKLFEVHTLLAQSVAASVHLISGLLNIPTEIFSEAPGILMVLVVVQRIGWTILEIGVESSGLLEISVLVSLVAFYPGWKPLPRFARMLIGAFLSWFANVLRLMVILFMLHYLGKQSLVLAHTFLGKTVFFFFTIAIYWFLITLPSLKMIENLIQQRREQNLTREPGGAP